MVKKQDSKKNSRSNSKNIINEKNQITGSISKKLKDILNIKGLAIEANINGEKSQKKDILDFYLSILRKIELLKFSINYADLNEKKVTSKTFGDYCIEIDNVKIDTIDEKECYSSICSKYGKDYFSNIFLILLILD